MKETYEKRKRKKEGKKEGKKRKKRKKERKKESKEKIDMRELLNRNRRKHRNHKCE